MAPTEQEESTDAKRRRANDTLDELQTVLLRALELTEVLTADDPKEPQ